MINKKFNERNSIKNRILLGIFDLSSRRQFACIPRKPSLTSHLGRQGQSNRGDQKKSLPGQFYQASTNLIEPIKNDISDLVHICMCKSDYTRDHRRDFNVFNTAKSCILF